MASAWECHAGLLASTLRVKIEYLTELISLISIIGRIQATSSMKARYVEQSQSSDGLTNDRKHRYLQYSLKFIIEF